MAMLEKEKTIRIRLHHKDKHIEKQNAKKRKEWNERKKNALFKAQTKKENQANQAATELSPNKTERAIETS